MCVRKKEIIAGRGFYYMPSPYGSLKITVEEKYNHEKMLETIGKLEKVHPTINNIVIQEDNRLWFMDDGKHVQINRYTEAEANSWKEVLKKLLLDILDLSKEPGVRVAVLEHAESFDLIVMLHHIYGDGISVKCIMSDLLYICSTGNMLEPKEPLTELSEKHLTAETYIPHDMDVKLNRIIEMWKTRRTDFSFETFYKMNSLHNKLVKYELTLGCIEGSDYLKLKEKCKELKLTINSALTTAIVAGVQAEDGIESIIPINTRPLLGLEDEKGIANFASSIRAIFHYRNDLTFWDNAVIIHKKIAEAKADIKRALENLYSFMRLDENILGVGYHAQYGMYKDSDMIMALRDVLELDIQKKTFDFSNIGKLVCDGLNKNIGISECYVIPNYTITCDYTFGAVSMDDVLTVSLVYTARRISPDRAEQIMNRIVGLLINSVL